MQFIWANRSKLNIMKTLLLKFKNNFLKGKKQEPFNTTQHYIYQLLKLGLIFKTTDQLFFIKNLNFKGVVFFGNAIFAVEIKD